MAGLCVCGSKLDKNGNCKNAHNPSLFKMIWFYLWLGQGYVRIGLANVLFAVGRWIHPGWQNVI